MHRFFPLPLLLGLSIVLLFPGCATDPDSSADAGEEFIGTWSLTDSEGGLFDVIVYSDGAAVSNWSKGGAGARGERGDWAATPGRITISYTNGWRDLIVRTGGGYRQISYAPGASLKGPPSKTARAIRIKGSLLPFVGVWKTLSADQRKPFYMSLKSDGTAAESLNRKARAKWKVVNGAAVIRWDTGWVDRIRNTENGLVDDAWQPGKNRYPGNPTATFKAEMVGSD